MSEIVKNELDAIKAFENNTEKRRSELTLNELNYISDKQLHKKTDEEGGGFKFDVLIGMETGYDSEVGDIQAHNVRYLEGSYESAVEAYSSEERIPRLGILNDINVGGCSGTLQIDGCEYIEPEEIFYIDFTLPDAPNEIRYAVILRPDGSIGVEGDEVPTEENLG